MKQNPRDRRGHRLETAGMDRRLVGIGVVVVALLAATVLPALVGRNVTGTAIAAPDIPVVGDCVLAPDGVSPTRIDPVKGWRLPSARVGDCLAANAARVLGLTFGKSVPPSADPYTTSTQLCGVALVNAERLSGASVYTWRGSSTFAVVNSVDRLQGELVLSDPSVSTRSRWLACVAADDSGAPLQLDLTRADSWGQLTSCLDVAGIRAAENNQYPIGNAVVAAISCSQPHVAQFLGIEDQTGGALGPKDYTTVCTEYAKIVTGMPDPTAGGQLVVQGLSTEAWAEGVGACLLVAADRSRNAQAIAARRSRTTVVRDISAPAATSVAIVPGSSAYASSVVMMPMSASCEATFPINGRLALSRSPVAP